MIQPAAAVPLAQHPGGSPQPLLLRIALRIGDNPQRWRSTGRPCAIGAVWPGEGFVSRRYPLLVGVAGAGASALALLWLRRRLAPRRARRVPRGPGAALAVQRAMNAILDPSGTQLVTPRRRAVMASLLSRRRVIHGFLATLARAGDLSADVRAARAEVEVIPDIPYGPHPVAHRLDVYRPRYAPRPLPVLVYIHGGAFVLCSKETHSGIALINAQQAGYLVFNINYRLAPNHRFPAAIADACAAYAWVVAHCAAFGGDPRCIVVAGESAGGNLALGVGIAASYWRREPYARAVFATGVVPVAVMPLMPYLHVSDPLRRCREPGIGYFARSVIHDIALAYLGDHRLAPAATLMADPVRVLEECGAPQRPLPYIFTGVGTADLCCGDVRRLEASCRALGVPIEAHYYPDEVHAFHALRWRSAARHFWRLSLNFLRHVAGSPPLPDDVAQGALDGAIAAAAAGILTDTAGDAIAAEHGGASRVEQSPPETMEIASWPGKLRRGLLPSSPSSRRITAVSRNCSRHSGERRNPGMLRRWP